MVGFITRLGHIVPAPRLNGTETNLAPTVVRGRLKPNAHSKRIRQELRYEEHEVLHLSFFSTLRLLECGELPRCSFNRLG